MTAKLPFTQAGLRRAIKAARAEGFRVRGIRPDGTLLVDDGENELPTLAAADVAPSKWEDRGA